MIIGRFPTFGLYVQMFTTGMKVFLISILLMLQLLISYYCMLVSHLAKFQDALIENMYEDAIVP